MRMLIVDDSKTMRRYLGAIAGELSIDAEEAVDGRDGLVQLDLLGAGRKALFDIALVDWDMPRMNGVEFVRAVRAKAEYASMKLMMVTSHNAMDDIRMAISAGADDYLMKPIDGAMVSEKLRIMGLIE